MQPNLPARNHLFCSVRLDNGIDIVGKCLAPMTSKGLRKMAAKYFEHMLAIGSH